MRSDIDPRFDACRRLDGTVSIVTGAGSGIGRGCAERLGREGAQVVCADIDTAGAEETVTRIVAAGGTAVALRLDVTDEAQAAGVAEEALTQLGRIDSLVNCAGIVRTGSAGDVSRADWDLTLQVNLTGTWIMCKAVLPAMVAQGAGSIVNIASVGALVATPENAPYLASKAGVAMLSKSIALDYAAKGVRCNAICPGTVMTPLVVGHWVKRGEADAAAMDAGLARARARYPVQRLGEAEEIAALAAYMASGESGFMTGAVVPVDGGMSIAAWLPGQ